MPAQHKKKGGPSVCLGRLPGELAANRIHGLREIAKDLHGFPVWVVCYIDEAHPGVLAVRPAASDGLIDIGIPVDTHNVALRDRFVEKGTEAFGSLLYGERGDRSAKGAFGLCSVSGLGDEHGFGERI